MKNFALVNDGLPVLTATPANDSDYQNGQVVEGSVWREFPLNIGHEELLNGWYFYRTWKKKPPIPGRFYIFNKVSGEWVYDIEAARSGKSTEISAKCELAILSGFLSDALDGIHHYPSDLTDQANLSASVTRSMLPGVDADETYPFKCADMEGGWQFRLHTASQIQKVGKDGYQFILSAREHNAALQSLIQLAADQVSIDAIAW